MNRFASFTLAFVALAGTASAQQRPDTRPGVAILDFEIGATIGQDPEDYQALRRGLASMAITELTANPAARIVERAQLQQILQEQNLGREGRVDPSSLANIGRLIGAKYMITGTLYDVRGDMRIDARIFDTETSQILRTVRAQGRMDDVFGMVERLSRELMTNMNLPALQQGAAQQFREQNPAPPQNAVMAYSRAVLYADRGDTQRAVEQYRLAIQRFPQFTQARTDCNRLQAGACAA